MLIKGKKFLIFLVVLLLFLPSIVYSTPPVIPWLVYGTVYFDGSPAPAGVHVYVKKDGQVLGEGTTDESGKYAIAVYNVSGGDVVEMWVESQYVTSVTVPSDLAPTEVTLNVTGVPPPPVGAVVTIMSPSNKSYVTSFTVHVVLGLNDEDSSVTHIRVYLLDNESMSAISYVDVSTSGTGTYETDVTAPTDGVYALNATAFDIGGNTSSCVVYSVYVDTHAPVFTDPQPPPYSSTNDTTPRISVRVSDALTGVDWSSVAMYLDGSAVPCSYDSETGEVYYEPPSPLSEGTHTVRVEAADLAGNTGSYEWQFSVSTTPPPPPEEATRIVLVAEPRVIAADGKSKSVIKAFVYTETGDPVPDGTVVNFTTTAGTLSAESATTVNGVATVELTSETRITTAVVRAVCGELAAEVNVYFVFPDYLPFVESYTIHVKPGWNLISLPLIPLNSSIVEVLRDHLSDVVVVWSYDAENGAWKFYAPGVPEDYVTLDEMRDGVGYWLNASKAFDLTIYGYVQLPAPYLPPAYKVVPGWNLIGFKETSPMSVEEYLRGVSYIRVITYDPDAGVFVTLRAQDPMTPGKGYWVAVQEEGWVYP